ncbi:MAG TPA: hypothetical protein VLH38_01310 [Patescibacteria group bacterium]|nr:hypothetical protein [Patescibacteria group bacterium]
MSGEGINNASDRRKIFVGIASFLLGCTLVYDGIAADRIADGRPVCMSPEELQAVDTARAWDSFGATINKIGCESLILVGVLDLPPLPVVPEPGQE